MHYIFFASDDVTVTAGCSASSQSSRDGRVAERSHAYQVCGLPIVLILTTLDYTIWRIMQERVYNKGKIANVESLGQRIVDEWERLDQRIIDGAVKDWRKRLRSCAAAEGGQFEHEQWLLAKHCCCNCALWRWRLIVWLLITFAVTVFSVFWLFQSHAAAVKRYNAFCEKLTAISDTEQNNISKSTFPVCVSEHFYI